MTEKQLNEIDLKWDALIKEIGKHTKQSEGEWGRYTKQTLERLESERKVYYEVLSRRFNKTKGA